MRCPSCPKRQRQTAGAGGRSEPSAVADGPETWDEKQMLDRVERFILEREGGREIYSLVSPLEWELVLLYDEQKAAYARGHQIRIESLFQMMVSMATRS